MNATDSRCRPVQPAVDRPVHREGDHGREIGERFADAGSPFELRDAAILQHVDELARTLSRPVADVSGMLTMLELEGLAVQDGPMKYRKA